LALIKILRNYTKNVLFRPFDIKKRYYSNCLNSQKNAYHALQGDAASPLPSVLACGRPISLLLLYL